MSNKIQTQEDLASIQQESEKQSIPDQKAVVTVSDKLRKRLHNLPDPKNPPLGYDDHKAFDKVFPYINIPALHPQNHGDTVIFNDSTSPANRLYLGDNLEVLRTLKSELIDLIYIDPPFFSGRNYNVIWGDSNEVRTFEDIWEGGITSYLIWLNARLWEMRRVLKKTGSIYVHCDWHASHYIKSEMDKIFGYENFRNEIIWRRSQTRSSMSKIFKRSHDSILFYTKSSGYLYSMQYKPLSDASLKLYENKDDKGSYQAVPVLVSGRRNGETGQPWHDIDPNTRGVAGMHWVTTPSRLDEYEAEGLIIWPQKEGGIPRLKYYLEGNKGVPVTDLWDDIDLIQSSSSESIGYPTQKPEAILKRVIEASSNEGDIVADFFCGGGTTQAVAQRLKRRFIGCDSSRVAVSVTLDRLVKIGEEMSGVKSNITTKNKAFQLGLQAEGIAEKVPNIEVYYLGVYPVEKFKNLNQEEFIYFVLTAYGASRNTGSGVTHGYKPPAQQEPIYIGPSDPNQSIEASEIKDFFDEIKGKTQPNKMIRAKIIAWRFSRQVMEYIKVLQRYAEKNNLPIELEAIPLDSKNFRKRILQRMPGVDEAELFLRFSKPPVVGDIKVKKIGDLEYEFYAEDAISTNEDGWLVNCQWDFDYQEGHFSANKDYILSREKKKDKKHGEIFEAVLKSKNRFEKKGEYLVACKVQDNLAGETILAKELTIK